MDDKHAIFKTDIPDNYLCYSVEALAGVDHEWLGNVKPTKGYNNSLFVGPEARTVGLKLHIKGSNNRVIIGAGSQINADVKIVGKGMTVLIGTRTTMVNGTIFTKGGANVVIGADCMLSAEIDIRTSDSHAIVDLDTMSTTNQPESILIGNHVWLAKGVNIARGTQIADDTIVGSGSRVRGIFPQSSTIIAGTPGKVVRERQTWARNPNVDPKTADLQSWKSLSLL